MTEVRMPNSEAWGAAAVHYERWGEPFTAQFARDALNEAEVKAGDRVLDIACGTGALSLMAAERGAQVTAVDSAPAMVARTQARLEQAGRLDARAQVMDGHALTFSDDAFDTAFSIFGVFLFQEPTKGMSEMLRALRPGGLGVIAAWSEPRGAGPFPLWAAAYEEAFPERELPKMPAATARLCDVDVLRGELEAAGFEMVRAVRSVHEWRAESVDAVCAAAHEIFFAHPVHAALPPDERAAVLDVLRAKLNADFGSGPVRLPATAHIALGLKEG